MVRPLPPAPLLGLILVGCAGDAPPPALPADTPNVLLISLDSVRADVLGAYGNRPRFTTDSPSPNLDRLAAEGLLCERAHATSSWTLPSHVALLTGVPDLVHAVEQDGHAFRATGEVRLLAQRLAGYRRAGFFSGPYLDPAFGFDQGFDTYRACYGEELAWARERLARAERELQRARGGSKGGLYTALEVHAEAKRAVEVASHRDRSSEVVADAVIAELERGGGFFVFAHFFDPHYDYAPPAEYAERFDPEYRGEIDGTDFIRDPRIAVFDPEAPGGRRRVASERDLQHLWALYEAEVAWTDAQVGRVLDALDRLGLADDTLVIVTSDHGDEFFEHGGLGHRRTLFDEVVHVPLIARWPGHVQPGSRIERPVSITEVAPTILRAAGVARAPAGPDPLEHLGPGLLAILAGAEPGPVLGRLVRSEEVTLPFAPDASATRVTVHESWHDPRATLRRRKSWCVAGADLPAADAEALAALATPDPATVTPDGPADRDTVEAAVRAYRAAYARLRALRTDARRVATTEDVLAALAGLGYVGQEARIGAVREDELVLPPPAVP